MLSLILFASSTDISVGALATSGLFMVDFLKAWLTRSLHSLTLFERWKSTHY